MEFFSRQSGVSPTLFPSFLPFCPLLYTGVASQFPLLLYCLAIQIASQFHFFPIAFRNRRSLSPCGSGFQSPSAIVAAHRLVVLCPVAIPLAFDRPPKSLQLIALWFRVPS